MGAGRSGTTLLDIILGNSEDIFSCGELVRFPTLRGIPHGSKKNDFKYTFWSKIEKKFFSKFPKIITYDDLLTLSMKIEFHRSFLINFFGFLPSKHLKMYKVYINNLFSSIFEEIDENIIIDSSKYPSRALALSRYLDYELYCIYLIRNPAHVVNAFQKKDIEQPSKNYFSANIYYFIINLYSTFVKFIIYKRNFVMIKYDDLVDNPMECLKKIESTFKIHLSKSKKLIENNKELNVGLLFDGNRIRQSKTINLKRKAYKKTSGIKNLLPIIINFFWWKEGQKK